MGSGNGANIGRLTDYLSKECENYLVGGFIGLMDKPICFFRTGKFPTDPEYHYTVLDLYPYKVEGEGDSAGALVIQYLKVKDFLLYIKRATIRKYPREDWPSSVHRNTKKSNNPRYRDVLVVRRKLSPNATRLPYEPISTSLFHHHISVQEGAQRNASNEVMTALSDEDDNEIFSLRGLTPLRLHSSLPAAGTGGTGTLQDSVSATPNIDTAIDTLEEIREGTETGMVGNTVGIHEASTQRTAMEIDSVSNENDNSLGAVETPNAANNIVTQSQRVSEQSLTLTTNSSQRVNSVHVSTRQDENANDADSVMELLEDDRSEVIFVEERVHSNSGITDAHVKGMCCPYEKINKSAIRRQEELGKKLIHGMVFSK